jgi:two-component system cell cycle sensor histidine kinase/response regulator CckA
MPDGGRLTVETAPVALGPVDRLLSPRAAPGEYVRLTITDTGTGIPADALSHVFEPFFSTKSAGWGPDLGLSSIDGLVAQAGGFMAVARELGGGSAFSVYLPRTRAEPDI